MDSRHRSFEKNLAFYAATAVLATLAALLLRQPQQEVTGDLTGRFSSALTCTIDGIDHTYREAALTNLLLIGVDREDGSDPQAGQADFLLLLTADRETRTLTPLHIDRDTITEVNVTGIFGDPAGTISAQICLSHGFGTTEQARCENTLQAVSKLLGGIPIDGYIAMDIAAIGRLNEALGGITVTLEDDFSQVDAAMTPGRTLTLTNTQAEIFLRYRNHVADGTNTNRMKRQRTYLAAALEKLETEDDTFVQSLLTAMADALYTNLTQSDLTDYFARWQRYTQEPIQTMDGTHTLDADGFVAFQPSEDWLNHYRLAHFFR